MAYNIIYNDANVSYGSRSLTINGIVYATDDFSFSEPVTEIIRTNHLDRPTGAVGTMQRREGSCTLQLATSSTVKPQMGHTFTTTEDSVPIDWIVRKVDRSESKGAEVKVPIDFVEKIGTLAVTTT